MKTTLNTFWLEDELTPHRPACSFSSSAGGSSLASDNTDTRALNCGILHQLLVSMLYAIAAVASTTAP